MIIKKLTMHNFGVYAGDNILEFKGKKPVVLIGGMNGRGKTTILEAILLGLYGMSSFAYTESKYNTYGQYLKSYVNKGDGTFEASVEIVFSMDVQGKEVYSVKREWSGATQRVHENISVCKNGELNAFLTENWPMFVENILPSALSNFFFFDGEKIAELAVEDTSEQMKESIKAMLGITVLDVLQGDMGRIINRVSKDNSDSQDLKKLEEFRIAKEEAEDRLKEVDNRIIEIHKDITQFQLDLEQLNFDYAVKGGGILEQKNALLKMRSESIANVVSCQEQLLELASGEMPLALVHTLLSDIAEGAKQEHERKVGQLAFEKVKKLYDSFPTHSDDVNTFIKYLHKETRAREGEDIYNLSDICLYQIDLLSKSLLEQSKSRATDLIKKRDKQQRRVDDIDNSLSVDINEKALNSLFEKIKRTERQIFEKQIELDNLNKERTTLHGNLIAAESEFSKFAEMTLSALETIDDNERTVKYAHMALEIINLYRVRLQERKTDILAKTMTDCYKKLANKKNLVDCIVMDPETLDLHYFDTKGEEIVKKRLSAGEKQLMVISLLWALAICSKKRLPVIIDTPLSRLDSLHRQALIKTYFPKASDQTIILSTDSEIDETYYEMIKKSVGDEYTLKYNDKTKNTQIIPGYFGWGGKEA